MKVEYDLKGINLCTLPIKESISSWIEHDILIPDTKPDAIKIINIAAYPYVNDFQVVDNKVTVNGKLNYYVIYKTNETNMGVRGLYISLPYTQTLNVKGVRKEDKVKIQPTVKNVIYSLPNERKILTKTEVIFKVKVCRNQNIKLIQSFKDSNMQIKNVDTVLNNVLSTKSNIIASREDVMVPNEDFYEMLRMDSSINNTEFKESYNKIMVKGDLNLNILYLADNQETEIKNMNIAIPFSGMIEFENINDKSIFDIDYSIIDINVKPNTDMTTKTMTVDYKINADVNMSENQEVRYVDDFYSEINDFEYDVETIAVIKNEERSSKLIEVKEIINDVVNDKYKIIDNNVDLSFITLKQVDNKVHVEGNAKISLLLQNIENLEIENKVIDIAINEEFEMDKNNFDLDIELEKITLNMNGNSLDVKLKLNVNMKFMNLTNMNMIDKIEMIDKLENLNGMNIYIVKSGDTLWKIAKKYKTTVDKIVKTNNIEDESKISIGEKILIIR